MSREEKDIYARICAHFSQPGSQAFMCDPQCTGRLPDANMGSSHKASALQTIAVLLCHHSCLKYRCFKYCFLVRRRPVVNFKTREIVFSFLF